MATNNGNNNGNNRPKQRTEAQARRSFVKLCAFIGLLVAAFLFVFGGLFSGSRLGSILEMVGKLALLIAVAFPAYEYSRHMHKAWRIIFWISARHLHRGLRARLAQRVRRHQYLRIRQRRCAAALCRRRA